jgi:hypothetical protein
MGGENRIIIYCSAGNREGKTGKNSLRTKSITVLVLINTMSMPLRTKFWGVSFLFSYYELGRSRYDHNPITRV